MPSTRSIDAFLRDIGPRWATDVPGNVKRVIAAYDPLLADSPRAGVAVERGLAYGDDPRQELDVYYPQAQTEACPVVIFVHGGAFTDGERNRSSQVYANVMIYLARHGVVGINMEYRQAPQHPYPAGTIDVALAMNWAGHHAARFGGDPAAIFLMGHSAGAAHAASLAFNPGFDRLMHQRPAGLIVVSGRVRADNLASNPNARKVEAYYGTDPNRLNELSAVTHAGPLSPPTFIAYAEFENPLIDVYCLELAYALALAKGKAPVVVCLAGHNHTSIIAHINTEEDFLGSQLLRFIEQQTPRR